MVGELFSSERNQSKQALVLSPNYGASVCFFTSLLMHSIKHLLGRYRVVILQRVDSESIIRGQGERGCSFLFVLLHLL